MSSQDIQKAITNLEREIAALEQYIDFASDSIKSLQEIVDSLKKLP